MKQSNVTLIGAGPGDAGLITVKGMRALQTADVVLYDELAATELLDYAPQEALKMYVGKRAGCPSFSQEEINGLIVKFARKRGHVVRLKGGDSFVFGRGYEELEYIRKHGIDVRVIPGLSSCVAVPASLEIPVTCRGVSESFWVITGTTRNQELSADLYLAVQSNATVVILMGMSRIHEICDLYQKEGKGHLPMAVIQHGTRSDEKSVIGQVWEIPRLVIENKLGTPAMMIIGEVVGLHPEYLRAYVAHTHMVA